MSLRVRPAGVEGKIIDITPENAGWQHVGFALHKLRPGQSLTISTQDREVCLVPVTGTFDARVSGVNFSNIGGRQDLFSQQLTQHLYVPEHQIINVIALDELELAVCSAPGGGGVSPRVIRQEDQSQSCRGAGSNTRFIHDILPETQPASSLLVVEVFTPAGHWSSYPPHKHCVDNMPHESALEETYYHRINPSQGFAFQRVYTDDRHIDESIAVENGDVVMVPEGYHPVGAAHGYDLYYLNVMAGPKRVWQFKNDPAHEWMLQL